MAVVEDVDEHTESRIIIPLLPLFPLTFTVEWVWEWVLGD
jgi:hypothetical protein